MMRKLRAVWRRLCKTFDAKQVGREFAAELESHLQMHVEDNLDKGLEETFPASDPVSISPGAD